MHILKKSFLNVKLSRGLLLGLLCALVLLVACDDTSSSTSSTTPSENGNNDEKKDDEGRVSTAPTDVKANPGDTQVIVSWTPPQDKGTSDIVKYTVYYSTTTGFTITDAGVSNTEQTDPSTHEIAVTGLTDGTQYYFVVTAHNSVGESAPSSQVTATPNASPPEAPTDVKAIPGNAQVTVSWTPHQDKGTSDIDKYTVYYSTTTGFTITDAGVSNTEQTDPSTHSIVVTGLTNGTPYYFVVTAHNATGESAPSGEATATPASAGKVNISTLDPSYDALTVNEGSAATSSLPKWGAGGPEITDVDYAFKTRPGGSTTSTIALDSSTGRISVSAGAESTYGGVHTITATAKQSSSGFTGTKDIDILITIRDDINGYPVSYGSNTLSIVAGTKSGLNPLWTGGTAPRSPDGTEARYAISNRPTTATTAHVTVDANSGLFATTAAVDIADSGEYTITIDGFGNYTGTTKLTITLDVRPGPPQALKDWQDKTRGAGFTYTKVGTAITTVEGLKAMQADELYRLASDIYIGDELWKPLHSSASPFTGKLYGDGFIIYGLDIDKFGSDYQGLFAVIGGDAVVSNLGIGVRKINANALSGAFAGYVGGNNPQLDNIAVAPTTDTSAITFDGVRDGTIYGGGVVGRLRSGTLNGFNYELDLKFVFGGSGTPSGLGGLVGINSGKVTGFSSGDIDAGGTSSAESAKIGGLVGGNEHISTVDNSGEVTGSASGNIFAGTAKWIGGLVGRNGSNTTVMGYASGDITTSSGRTIGGLVGSNFGRVIGSASGNVETNFGGGSYIGGLIGHNEGGTVTGFARGNVISKSDNGSIIGGLVGRSLGGKVKGLTIGWVMVRKNNPNLSVGAVVGENVTSRQDVEAYYNSDGGDHVGKDAASSSKYNEGKEGSTGTRGTNDNGDTTGIPGIASATASNMGKLEQGDNTGQWTFASGKWPTLNLPAIVTDNLTIDYSTSPTKPTSFVD